MIAAPTSDGSSSRTRVNALDRIVRAIGGPRDQAEDVIGLRPIGQRGLRRFELLARRLGLAAVEQRDAEIQARERQRRIDLERAAEGGDGGGEVVLLEARDADVVGAVGVLAGGTVRRLGDWLDARSCPRPTLG